MREEKEERKKEGRKEGREGGKEGRKKEHGQIAESTTIFLGFSLTFSAIENIMLPARII